MVLEAFSMHVHYTIVRNGLIIIEFDTMHETDTTPSGPTNQIPKPSSTAASACFAMRYLGSINYNNSSKADRPLMSTRKPLTTPMFQKQRES